MRKSFLIGAIAFTTSYLVLGLVAAWAMDVIGWNNIWLHYLFGDVMAAGFAIPIGLAVGRLTARSVAFCSLGLQLTAFLVSAALLAAIPYRGGYPIHWLGVFRALSTPGAVLSVIMAVASSVVWLLVFRRFTPRLAFHERCHERCQVH